MTDMESLDRAVEEAITDLIPKYTDDGWEVPIMRHDLQPLIAAVSERARAEERELVDVLVWREHAPVTGTQHDPANGLIHGYCQRCRREWPCEWSPERARSSEEAGG